MKMQFNDLRIREAYRLLQTCSHISIPRIHEPEEEVIDPPPSTGSPTNPINAGGIVAAAAAAAAISAFLTRGPSAQRVSEARVEMHLAAAGVRATALPLGRGMLTLSCLAGSRLPDRLTVPAILLRGRRAVSPNSRRRHQVDLARCPEPSLPQPPPQAQASVASVGMSAGAQTGTSAPWHSTVQSTGATSIPRSESVGLVDLGDPTDIDALWSSDDAAYGPQTGVFFANASDHPYNAIALATASAVAACGVGASLRTACMPSSLMRLPVLAPKRSYLSTSTCPSGSAAANGTGCNPVSLSSLPSLAPLPPSSTSLTSTPPPPPDPRLTAATLATGAANAAAAFASTANLQQSASVLAAKHWPAFHNGVATGLMISPHASIDSTWIMHNLRSLNQPPSHVDSSGSASGTSGLSTGFLPTPEQAGLLLGLGLNGHLNKMSAYCIQEYLVRVHDLHNMAVLLGISFILISLPFDIILLLKVFFKTSHILVL
ncbi:unnamed protein product [Protopolystoma xenopodis]|uniref:Uncharacterized protein n=1 Tax=Protopolystoma xenopodis TaxID=117903 RepID=A0A3S5CDW1_9PLAT|nr:unnamed protein product [Protopolystoma xenopodis]